MLDYDKQDEWSWLPDSTENSLLGWAVSSVNFKQWNGNEGHFHAVGGDEYYHRVKKQNDRLVLQGINLPCWIPLAVEALTPVIVCPAVAPQQPGDAHMQSTSKYCRTSS